MIICKTKRMKDVFKTTTTTTTSGTGTGIGIGAD